MSASSVLTSLFDFITASSLTLSTSVTELSERSMEQPILLPKWLLSPSHVCLLDLKLHVRICDLGNVRDEEYEGQNEDKDGYAKVHPLYILQGSHTVARVFETATSQHDSRNRTATQDVKVRKVTTYKTYEPSTGPMTVPMALNA